MRAIAAPLLITICSALTACSEKPSEPEPLTLTPAEEATLARYVSQCWQNDDLAAPAVRVYIAFRETGHIRDIHVIPAEMDLYDNDKAYRQAADKALMSLKRCNPFSFLPAEKYEEWKKMVLTLDPKKGR